MILFNTAYGLVKKNKPFTDFYTACAISDKSVIHFTSFIAKALRQKTTADIHKARFVFVMSDGSTDRTIVEQEVLHIRHVDHGNPVTKLASI